ncbi:MAG: hypothetical protein AAFN08_08020 [Cyanobacteria bacterium J06559_3]
MSCPTYPDPSVLVNLQALNRVHPTDLSQSPEREQLRHLIIGSPEGVRSTIHTLHVLNYAEHLRWSQLITIPTSGLVITPQQGEVMSFLLRHWQLS